MQAGVAVGWALPIGLLCGPTHFQGSRDQLAHSPVPHFGSHVVVRACTNVSSRFEPKVGSVTLTSPGLSYDALLRSRRKPANPQRIRLTRVRRDLMIEVAPFYVSYAVHDPTVGGVLPLHRDWSFALATIGIASFAASGGESESIEFLRR
jgi:hypothetical protein